MVVNFMGLTGPSGVLPLYYTELIRERLRAKDRAMYVFLNMFNHRMLSLFYQAWEKYRFAVARERGERDRFTHHLLDLFGLGTRGLRGRQKVADESLVFYGGLLAMHTRSAAALKSIIEDYFEVPADVEQFVGGWRGLSGRDVTHFANGNAYCEQLGSGAVVGDEIWDMQSGVRVTLGPMTFEQYRDFLPQGIAHEPLRAITRFFAGDEIDFEVQLILKRDEVPACELSSTGELAPQLGWSTWVRTTPMGRDPGDTILKL
jgi:type VI secretion system protein ImpH